MFLGRGFQRLNTVRCWQERYIAPEPKLRSVLSVWSECFSVSTVDALLSSSEIPNKH